MSTSALHLPCDGCGLPASPEHIAARLRRLELSTRFRPIHIGVLFILLTPPIRPQDDFYGPPESKEFFNSLLNALEISAPVDQTATGGDARAKDSARLAEFQRRGFYLTYLSECPSPQSEESAAVIISRLAPTLIRRIRFNYKPKQVAPLGQEMAPLLDVLRAAGIDPTLHLAPGTASP